MRKIIEYLLIQKDFGFFEKGTFIRDGRLHIQFYENGKIRCVYDCAMLDKKGICFAKKDFQKSNY